GNDGWSSTYGIAGTHWLLQKYSELFGMPKDELDGLKAKEKFKVNQNPLTLFTEDDLTTTADGKKVFKEGKSPYKKHRPDGTDINNYASSFHVLDQTLSLGIYPNYFSILTISTSDKGKLSSIEYLEELYGADFINGIPTIGTSSVPGSEHIRDLSNTHLKFFYGLNINTLGSGFSGWSKTGNVLNSQNWGEEYKDLLSSIAFTSRRFREIDRVYSRDEKYQPTGALEGYDEYLAWKNTK
ncbi:hypothetical protein OF375_00005, partial [Ureaplasma miroungigenitalium]